MRRRPGRAGGAAASFFFLGMLIGIVALLSSMYYSVVSPAPLDDVTRLNRAIRAVDGAQVRQLLVEMNRSGVPRTFASGQHPLYAITCIPEEVTAEAQAMVRDVTYTFRSTPIDLDYIYHPLTAAYRHHRFTVATILVEVWSQFPSSPESPMTEIYAVAISLRSFNKLDPSVFLVCRDESNCAFCREFVSPARVREEENSQLVAAFRARYGKRPEESPRAIAAEADLPHNVIAPGSTIRADLWSDPFRPPLPNLLPPRGYLVVNPGYFSNLEKQLLYMVFGDTDDSKVLTGFVLYSLGVTGFCLLSWSIGMVVWMLFYR